MTYTDEKYLQLCYKMLPKTNSNISRYLTKSERIQLEQLITSEIRATMIASINTKKVDERLLTLRKIKILLSKVAERKKKKTFKRRD